MLERLQNLINVILGRASRPAPALSERIFAIGHGALEMEARLDAPPTGFAALAFRNVQSSQFSRLEGEIDTLVRASAAATGTKVEMLKDQYNYLWLLVQDQEFEDLVATMHLATSTLEEQGFGPTLLAAAFQFEQDGQGLFWLYNFKRGLFYPFAPRPNRTRDQVLEMRLKGLLAEHLPIEEDLARWYPLWEIPGDPLRPANQLPGRSRRRLDDGSPPSPS